MMKKRWTILVWMLLGLTALVIPGWLALNEWQKWRLAYALEGEWVLEEGYSKTLWEAFDGGERLIIRRTRGYEMLWKRVNRYQVDSLEFDAESLNLRTEKQEREVENTMTVTVDSGNTLLWWGGEWEVELKDGGQVLVLRNRLWRLADVYRRVR